MPTNYAYRVIESYGTCASTGDPSEFRTVSRHRDLSRAVKSWKPFARLLSYVIVDAEGRMVHWETDERGRVFEVDAPFSD